MPARNAGTSTTAMFASARSRSAAATLTTPIRGNGLAGSTPAVIRESIKRAPPNRSTRPSPTSSKHGPCFYRSEPRPTFRNGAISGIGLPRNTAASIAASKITERQSVQVAPKGIGHRPEGGISAAARSQSGRSMIRFPFPAVWRASAYCERSIGTLSGCSLHRESIRIGDAGVPALTGSADIKLNTRLSLRAPTE